MKSLPRLLGLVVLATQLQASFASFASSLDSLYIDGHCEAAVNGVWERSTSVATAANVENVTFQRQDLRLYRRDDGDWVLVAPIGTLGRSLEPSPVPATPSTRSSEWEIWCSDASNAMNGTLLMACFSQEIYDLSTNLCGERLSFSRISRHLYFAGNASGSGHFLFFNCSRSSWHITTSSMGLLELSGTCEPSYPSHSWAICDGSMINLTLHQEFYPVTGCGSEFFPEGRTANGAPLYRADDPRGDASRYLYFDHCASGTFRWILSGGSCEGETSAATGPPLGDADACDFAAKDNIQLPLDVYKLWTLPGFSEALSEKQKLCDVAPTAFAPGEFQPDLEYLKVMAGPETLIRRMLIYSRNPEDLEEVAKELDVTFVVSQGWPFAFIFVWLPLALSLLCSAIPSCHCCRCFARERRTKYRMKVLLFIILTLVLIGIATCIGIASAGLQTLEEGQLMSHCTSSQLMSTTLDGDGVDFVGLRPLLQRIDAVLQGQEKEAFLSRTQRVVRSAQLATATLQLLSSTLDALDVEVAATRHRCGYCEELRPTVQAALEKLENYLAKSPVATQRALEGRDLHNRLSAAAATLSRLQQLALEALPFLYAENGLGRVWSETFGILVGFILLQTILLVVTFIMAYGSMASFAQEPRETGITGQGEYLRRTSACSCCSWCFFSGLAVMMCAMAGCIVVAYSQLGGFCLELHSDAKADLFRTTGLSQHMADMHALDVLGILQVTSSCLPKEGSPATDVFALLQASPSGPSVREVLSDFTGRMPTALPEISELRRYVRDTPVDALLLPSADAQSNPRYRAMLTDLRTRIGFSSSVACADWTLPGQQVIPGMETFFESFRSMGVASGSCNSSNQSLICSEVVTTSGQACRAAQRFVKAKNLLRKKRFRCDLFADASEVPCDVKDMVKVNGEWQPCVPHTVHRRCDLDEFRTYLMDFDVRLSNVFQMLGEEMEVVNSSDLTDLRILTAPIPGGCENFALFWQRFLNGLCFVSLPGLRTITMSFLVASGVALSGVIVMYFVWRRAYDNFSRSQELFKAPDKAPGSATPRAQGTAGTGAAERTAGVTFWISDEDDTLEI